MSSSGVDRAMVAAVAGDIVGGGGRCRPRLMVVVFGFLVCCE